MSTIGDAKVITSIYNIFVEDSAKIAGGYVRDTLLGRDPKDVDIIVEFQDERDIKEAYILANRLGYDVYDYGDCYVSQQEAEHNDDVVKVLQLSKQPNRFETITKIDIVFVQTTVMGHIESFQCSLSKAWLQGNVMRRHEDFHASVENKTLYFTKTATREYVERMISYFPEYKQETYA
jgi:hypothetical protein